jgi:Cu/Ag efflux pump CusA
MLLSALIPLSRLGSEFMPPMDEGTLLYMPTALPGLSAGKASQLLQLTDRMIKTVPEVDHVLRQGGSRRYGYRSRAAGDVRDHHHLQAEGAVAARHDDGQDQG